MENILQRRIFHIIALILKDNFFYKEHLLTNVQFVKNLFTGCIEYHHHIDCQFFFEDNYEDIKIEKNDKLNNIYKNLFLLSKAFKNFYTFDRTHKYLSSNIIENYYLIKQINKYINESLKNNKKHQNFTIISNYYCNYDECKYLIYNNGQFIDKYEILILHIQVGDLRVYHKMNEICEFYKEKNNLIYSFKSNILYNGYYLYYLSNYITSSKKKFLLAIGMLTSFEYNLLTLNLIKFIDSLILRLNLVEANVEFLKQLNIKIHHKLDFEQRIKAGKIIAKSILKSFYDKLDKIKFRIL